MNRSVLIIFCLLFSLTADAQRHILQFHRGKKVIYRYWEGEQVAFLLHSGRWEKGFIEKLTTDSIYIKPIAVLYSFMKKDTLSFNVNGYRIDEIAAMPKPGYLIDFRNNRFDISPEGGHVHFYWVKSGVIFRWGAAAYLTVAAVNQFITHKNKITGTDIAYTAGVYGFGVLLKHLYKPIYKVRGKYHFKIVSL